MEETVEDFEELLNNQEFKRFGKLITGNVIAITKKDEIYVDFGYKADGIIYPDEFSQNGDNPRDKFKIGDQISAYVLRWNDGYGNVELSYKKYAKESKWKKRQEQKQEYIKQKEEEQQIKEQQRQKFWSEVEIGKEYVGKIQSIVSYGLFVDLGGASGLLHKSQIYWDNSNLEEDFEVGDSIKVKILNIDYNNLKIALSYPQKPENPKKILIEKYKVGDIVTGKITKLISCGALMQIEDNLEGLIHNSQITMQKRVVDPSDVLEIDQMVNAKIINIDEENLKISLSIKEIEGTSKEYGFEEFVS